MAERDPISQVYDALWAMLEAHQGFVDLVRPGNRIKASGENLNPVKDEVSETDLPEVRIVATGGSFNTHLSSSKAQLVKQFEIQLSTGDQRLDALIFPVQWEIFRAFSVAGWIAALQDLTWAGAKFVVSAEPLSTSEGKSMADLNRGIKGWAAAWACRVTMHFSHTALAPEPVA